MANESVDGVAIPWAEARGANLANWDDRVPLHRESYGLDAYRADPEHLSDVVTDDLPVLAQHLPGGTLEGLDLCHLQCHIGTDTVSLARAGARVVGVDFSRQALDAAAEFAAELGIPAEWVETDVLDARAGVDSALGSDRLFDVVYTSIGTITWLADLTTWAAQVAALLRPGGVFYIRDAHPSLLCLDEYAEALTVSYRYFADGTASQWDDDGTYAGDGKVAHPRTYEYPHPLSEVVTALLASGLVLVAFDEGKTLPWAFSTRMVPLGNDDFAWPGDEAEKVPCTFTLVARKP